MKTIMDFNAAQFNNEKGQDWIYPPRPSNSQMKLFGEIVKQCRLQGINENAVEVRVGRLWVDIAIYYRNYKIAVEVNGPDKQLYPKRTRYLEHHGWKVINVPVKYIDRDVVKTATLIIDQVVKIVEKVS